MEAHYTQSQFVIATSEPSLLEGPDDPNDPMLEPVLGRGANEKGGATKPQVE